VTIFLESEGGPATGPVPITVTVANRTAGFLVVLEPYFTPNLVSFTVNGREEGPALPFDGPFARLEPAGEDRFHRLAPGETVSVEFDLAEHFSLQPGEYMVVAEYRNPAGASHEGDRAITFEPGEGPTSPPITIEVTG
jgi:hypothetical protein